MTTNPSLALRAYIVALSVALAASLALATRFVDGDGHSLWSWAVLTALFGLAEFADLSFHEQRARYGLSSSEALLLPMLVGLSPLEVIAGATVAIAVVRLARWRGGVWKGIFNVAQYGCASAAAAFLYAVLPGSPGRLFPPEAVFAVIAVLVFSLLSHVLTLLVVALAERRSTVKLSRNLTPAWSWNLAGSISLGLVFAAAYAASEWSVLLFPLPLLGLYFGYRAVVRQSRERERVENLHAASRALAASNNFEDALVGFLTAMNHIVSSAEALAVMNVNKQWVLSSVRGDEVKQSLAPLGGGPLLELVEKLRAERHAVRMSDDEADQDAFFKAMGASGLVAVALVNGDEYAGCLIALDRVGAEEFGDNDARLLEALGHELVLTLDSYRLFAEVTEERERFQKIFDGSKEGICLLDGDGVVRAWNPALARITGFDEEEVLGAKWSDRVLVRDRSRRRIEGRDIINVAGDEELELVTRQGPPRWVAITSGAVQTGDEEESWVLLVRDITAEHELEESKSDFLATISHELRTPLTTIKGSLEVLGRPDGGLGTDTGNQMIEIMKRGSDRLERLVMNLLAVSQMETGEVQVFPEKVDLEDLVRSRIAAILMDHAQVEVLADEPVVVRADKERLAQAVEHLLDNARKFGPESGRISIEVGKDNGYAHLSVADEGPGIARIDQERIFDRFVRLGDALTRETQGPGVGLFIVKRSIEAMGGSVEVESEPDRGGSTFHLRVPLGHPMAASESNTA